MDSTAVTEKDVWSFISMCVYARSVYRHYKALFESGSDTGSRFVQVAPICLGDIARVLKEYLILQVCKLTDPDRDHRGNENLSITFFTGSGGVSAALLETAAKLRGFGRKLKPARNKIISHFDRETTHAGEPMGGASNDEWNSFWHDLQAFCAELSEEYLGQRIYINAAGQTDAEIIPQLVLNRMRIPIAL
ncbi:MAG: hypothetical protein JO008_02925 [Alphaproteobacteria bacterium]|nr:hypothetical protein [Alphaproteobacteria bacterium]